MTNSRHLFLRAVLFTTISLFIITGCNSEDESDTIIDKFTTMEAGTDEVSFTIGDDWNVANILNNGSAVIYGNIFGNDGKLVKENAELRLEGLGTLEARWNDKGFVVSRLTPQELKIRMDENFTGEPFNITIILRSGERTGKISISRPASKYSFNRIEYAYSYVEEQTSWVHVMKFSFQSNANDEQIMTFFPFQNMKDKYQFVCSTPAAFAWYGDKEVKVQAPKQVCNNLTDDSADLLYTSSTVQLPTKFDNIEANIKTDSNKDKTLCNVEAEYRTLNIPYRIYAADNETGNEIYFEGHLIYSHATGQYRVVME